MHALLPDLAHEHQAGLVAEARRFASVPGSHVAGPRHAAAVVLARISRASAAGVRRLDRCLADDLARRMVRPDGV